MIPVSKFSSRLGERPRLVVLHTAEGARDVYTLAAFLNRPGVQASYHGAVDDQRYEAYVNYSNAAWALRNGNQESDNLCLCAFAGWSRQEWLRHPRMLELTAAWIAERCRARNLPPVRLTDLEVGKAMLDDRHPGGWADHDAYTKGTALVGRQDGTHWDVGENFPFDVVGRRVQELARVVEDDLPTPREVWDWVLPDPFPGAGPKPARDLLGWAAAHAAVARTEAAAAKAAAAALAAQVTAGDVSEAAVLERIDARVQEALAALPKAQDLPNV